MQQPAETKPPNCTGILHNQLIKRTSPNPIDQCHQRTFTRMRTLPALLHRHKRHGDTVNQRKMRLSTCLFIRADDRRNRFSEPPGRGEEAALIAEDPTFEFNVMSEHLPRASARCRFQDVELEDEVKLNLPGDIKYFCVTKNVTSKRHVRI
ncbi:flagellar basal-body rod protein FlgB [Anopheles sinensis]|uniref:Flagellar basal-body rod protein FlgB n=1 Tax=Anopheles sinensis TaxID=74873 RepID=A0A084WAP5_ANOSI|nr:flagellar basal-body rod protein FlgB [Anopheles sinensis]